MKWHSPCGKWNHRARKESKWFFEDDTSRVYCREEEGQWSVWQQIPCRTRRKRFSQMENEYVEEPPIETWVIASGYMDKGNYAMTGKGNQEYIAEEIDEESAVASEPASYDGLGPLERELQQVDPALQWAIEEVSLPADGGRAIIDTIKDGRGRCISDGSLKNLFGTSAYKFMLDDHNAYIGMNRVPGMDRDQTSYRSELCGMLGNVILVNALCRAFSIASATEITIACDNESAIWKTFSEDAPDANDASGDILCALRHQINESPLT